MPKRKSTTAATPSTAKKQKHENATPTQPATAAATPSTISSDRPRRAASSQVTPKQSKYFEHSTEEDEEEESDANAASDSGYEEVDNNDAETSSAEVEEEEESESEDYSDSDSDRKPAKRNRKSKSQNKSAATHIQGKDDLWREGVKTGLGPGHQVFIAKPKARDDRGIKYVPEKLHPNTLDFLSDLKKNNDRVWLKAHDADYRMSWKDFESFVEALTEKIVEVDETIPELPPKDLVFRIYRDVRFSSDPTPYKPHFSAAWSRTGRKGPYACYYVHIQPGGRSFVGSGLWHPDAAPVALLRTDIDQRPDRIRNVLVDPKIRKSIFGGVSKDPKKAVKAFCEQNKENALKTKPKGYEVDNPNIDLLRLKNFTIGSKVSDEDVISGQGLDRIMELISVMQPFVSYLNSVVMPDEEAVESTDDPSSSDE